MSNESTKELQTWKYLRNAYYHRFVEGVSKLPWDVRYDVLREIHGEWEPRGEDPVASMMDYVYQKSYFPFFVRGVVVDKEGYFTLHPLICNNLGSVGIFDDTF